MWAKNKNKVCLRLQERLRYRISHILNIMKNVRLEERNRYQIKKTDSCGRAKTQGGPIPPPSSIFNIATLFAMVPNHLYLTFLQRFCEKNGLTNVTFMLSNMLDLFDKPNDCNVFLALLQMIFSTTLFLILCTDDSMFFRLTLPG